MEICTFFSYSGRAPNCELELLDSFRRSVKNCLPATKITVLTDNETSKILKDSGYICFTGSVRRETLLLDRLKLFKLFLQSHEPNTLCVMLDFDMLMLKPIQSFLDDNIFDCAYTLRQNSKKFPINGGFVAYRNNVNALSILDKLIIEFEKLPIADRAWWGDQICLSNFFIKELITLKNGLASLNIGKVFFISASEYNYTPYDMDVSLETLRKNLIIDSEITNWIDSPLETKYVLHFKGLRKHLQLQIDWQMRNQQSYIRYIEHESHFLNSEIYKNGSKFLFSLFPKYQQFIINDLAICFLLHLEKDIFSQSINLRDDMVYYLKSVGDYRWKIFDDSNLDIRQI